MQLNGFTLTTKESSYKTTLDRLDENQRAAAMSESPKLVIKAPAGAGKTSTLIAAIATYRYNNVNDRICAITYTRAARAELEARLTADGVHDVEVTTIHAWARNRLEVLAHEHRFKIKILEEAAIKTILRQLVDKYLLTSRVKYIDINILYTYITGSKKMDVSENYRRTLNALDTRYVAYKRDNNLYDFTDYPLYLYDVLLAYNETINDIDALFVDEFQDVDEIQLQVFDKVLAKKKCFIGDSWQSIYQFRGADGAVFNKLNGFDIYKLKTNYRSYQEIINYTTTVYLTLHTAALSEEDCYIGEVMNCDVSAIHCARGEGGQVYVVNPFGRNVRFGNCHFASKTADLLDDFMKLEPMILCRTNKQVKAVQSMGYYNVDTVHQAKGLEYQNVIVIDMVISSTEDLNIAYVAMTRAQDNLLVINWTQFENLFRVYMKKHTDFDGGAFIW